MAGEWSMSVNIKVDIDTDGIMRARGLGGDKGAQKFLASEIVRFCDPYVPMQQGILKNQHTTAPDGSQIVYTQPYAHYQYHGKVMGGRAPKKYTGAALTYHGAPMRGPQWEKRMMADKRGDLEKSIESYIKKG